MEEMLYTVKEVSQILKTNVNYVNELRRAGLITFMKLGSLKCRKQELERFLKANEGKDLSNPLKVVDL